MNKIPQIEISTSSCPPLIVVTTDAGGSTVSGTVIIPRSLTNRDAREYLTATSSSFPIVLSLVA